MDVFIRTARYRGPVRAVVLDWAGTAVDHGSIGPMAVFGEVFAAYGLPVGLEEIRPFMGLMKKDHIRGMLALPSITARWLDRFGRLPGEADVEALYADTEPMMVRAVANHAEPVPGLPETVALLRDQGIAVGSSTGYTRPMMEVLVPAAAGYGYSPDFWTCSSDVPAGRPWPWMCYLNAMHLGVHPMEAMLKVGDTVIDVHEGLNAGMWTVAVTRTGNELGLTADQAAALHPAELAVRLDLAADKLRAAGAHYVIEGVWELPVVIEDVESRLAAGELPLPANGESPCA